MYVPTTKRDMSQGQFISYFGLFLKFKESEREKDATISPMQYAYANEYSMQKRHFGPSKREKIIAPLKRPLSLLPCTAILLEA